MVQKRVALPAAGIGAVAAGGLLGRSLVRSWAKNPDPLEGAPVRFPDGVRTVVPMADGAELMTVSVGEGPIVLLVHGLTASKDDFGPIAAGLLESGHRLVAVDQRGHGDSTGGTAGYGSAQLAEDLAQVITQLDLRVAALVGHSMGGMTAMALAVHHPQLFRDRVEHLVLVATAASLSTVRHRIGLSLGAISLPTQLIPEDERLRVGAGLGVFGRAPSLHMVDEAIDMFRACPEDVRAEATGALQDHDVVDLLHRIDVPTLVVGAGRDQLIRPHQVRALAEGIPGARLETFPDAGHMVHWEHHRELAGLIVDHIRVDHS